MKLYRSKYGEFLGVCKGVADWTGVPVRYIRIAAVLATFLTRGWFVLIYLAAAVFLPVRRTKDYESAGFKENFEDLRNDTMDFAKREYSNIKEARWNKNFNDGNESHKGKTNS